MDGADGSSCWVARAGVEFSHRRVDVLGLESNLQRQSALLVEAE